MDYQQELITILERPVTVATIDTYPELALTDLISFISNVSLSYADKSPDFTASSGRDLEEQAMAEYDLPRVEDVLDTIQQRINRIRRAEAFIDNDIQRISEVITPPDDMKRPLERLNGEGAFEAPQIGARLKTLLYILQNQGIELDKVEAVEGELAPGMMRTKSYVTVTVPQLDRVVQLCDERGNASYIFSLKELLGQGLSVEEINRMTKEEKNELIDLNNGPQPIGKRLVHNENWEGRLEKLLLEDIPGNSDGSSGHASADTREATEAEIPKAIMDKENEWFGFWADENGNHWSTVYRIQVKLGLSQIYLEKTIEQHSLSSLQLRSTDKKQRTAYCVEELLQIPEVMQAFSLPRAEKDGPHKNFWQNPMTGKRYGALRSIAEITNIPIAMLNEIVDDKANPVEQVEMRAISGRPFTGHALEDITSRPEIAEMLKRPVADKEGEWAGYWTDPTSGQHFGAVGSLKSKLDVGEDEIRAAIKRLQLEPRIIRNAKRTWTESYPLEAIEQDEIIRLRSSAPSTERLGEWKGFHIDSDGKHWAAVLPIRNKLGIAYSAIQTAIQENELQSRPVFAFNKIVQAYCLEDLVATERVKSRIVSEPPAI